MWKSVSKVSRRLASNCAISDLICGKTFFYDEFFNYPSTEFDFPSVENRHLDVSQHISRRFPNTHVSSDFYCPLALHDDKHGVFEELEVSKAISDGSKLKLSGSKHWAWARDDASHFIVLANLESAASSGSPNAATIIVPSSSEGVHVELEGEGVAFLGERAKRIKLEDVQLDQSYLLGTKDEGMLVANEIRQISWNSALGILAQRAREMLNEKLPSVGASSRAEIVALLYAVETLVHVNRHRMSRRPMAMQLFSESVATKTLCSDFLAQIYWLCGEPVPGEVRLMSSYLGSNETLLLSSTRRAITDMAEKYAKAIDAAFTDEEVTRPNIFDRRRISREEKLEIKRLRRVNNSLADKDSPFVDARLKQMPSITAGLDSCIGQIGILNAMVLKDFRNHVYYFHYFQKITAMQCYYMYLALCALSRANAAIKSPALSESQVAEEEAWACRTIETCIAKFGVYHSQFARGEIYTKQAQSNVLGKETMQFRELQFCHPLFPMNI